MRTVLRRANKIELVKACIEKEKEGWTPVAPIREEKGYHKVYKYHSSTRIAPKRSHLATEEKSVYIAVYEKKEAQ
ncbi:hypothetical protein HXA35_20495 [Bacillus sp. A301a_S52]|nr:hypothetical protein [Bacillus sp. A301a_S52]